MDERVFFMKKTMRFTAVILVFVLVSCMFIPSLSAYASDNRRLLGDTDNDGEVMIIDVTLIQRYLAGMITLDAKSIEASDVDSSGEVEITDATFIQRWLVQIPVGYAIGEPITDYRMEKTAAVQILAERLDDYRKDVYVYRDYNDAVNHYTQRARMGSWSEINENCTEDPYSGSTCIRCSQEIYTGNWTGWMFLNGYQKKHGNPGLNRGDEPGQGMDLTGVKELRFFARGENGGETAEFYTAGFTTGEYHDTAPKQSLGTVTLTDEWQEYVIPLDGVDMSYICNGFAYVTNDRMNGYPDGEVVFYLDDIRFTGDIAYAKNAPVLLRSYDTDKKELCNTAFTYDNTLVAMAFLGEGMYDKAEEILDAFVYASENDRYQPGRIRNAYRAGCIAPDPGWEDGARVPGFIGKSSNWDEDAYQVGSNVGNTSYVALAMLQYDRVRGTNKYLETAKTLMDWVLIECTDGGIGFTGGYDGWPEKGEKDTTTHTYKSLEHNIDSYSAFKRLYEVTSEEKYGSAADSSLAFIRSMYNEETGWFYTGTTDDGVTPNTDVVVLDTQVWSAMAMGDLYEPYASALDLVDSMKTDGAYPFCQENKNGGFWCEGSAFTALMFDERGEHGKFIETMDTLCGVQLDNGLFPAATVDNLSTGIYLSDGSPWEYGTNAHITPTAWFIMAVNGFDPYRF